MSSTRRCLTLALYVALAIATSPRLLAGPIPEERLVVADFWGSLQEYTLDGTPVRSYTGTGIRWEGASMLPDGRLITTRREPTVGINLFTRDGAETTFATPEVAFPGDLSVFSDGTIAVNDQTGSSIELYSAGGQHLQSIPVPLGVAPIPFGSHIGADDTLWITLPSFMRVLQFSREGTLLRNLGISFRAGDLVLDPLDGTLWVPDSQNNRLYHLSTTGAVLSSFTTGVTAGLVNFNSVAIDSQGVLYVTGSQTDFIYTYNRAGQLLGSFPSALADPSPIFMSVVLVPEPSSIALAVIGMLALALRRRKS